MLAGSWDYRAEAEKTSSRLLIGGKTLRLTNSASHPQVEQLEGDAASNLGSPFGTAVVARLEDRNAVLAADNAKLQAQVCSEQSSIIPLLLMALWIRASSSHLAHCDIT